VQQRGTINKWFKLYGGMAVAEKYKYNHYSIQLCYKTSEHTVSKPRQQLTLSSYLIDQSDLPAIQKTSHRTQQQLNNSVLCLNLDLSSHTLPGCAPRVTEAAAPS